MKIHAIVAATLFLAAAGAAAAIEPQEIVRRGKRATALVHVRAAGAVTTQGSAFCIDAGGYFITTRSAARIGATTAPLALLLHAGDRDQTIVGAEIVRQNKATDLVMLKISGTVPNLTALELAGDAELEKTRSAKAFGFDFFSTPNPLEQPPAVRVTGMGIQAPRPLDGAWANLELDTPVHPTNNGGPILDEAGRVRPAWSSEGPSLAHAEHDAGRREIRQPGLRGPPAIRTAGRAVPARRPAGP